MWPFGKGKKKAEAAASAAATKSEPSVADATATVTALIGAEPISASGPSPKDYGLVGFEDSGKPQASGAKTDNSVDATVKLHEPSGKGESGVRFKQGLNPSEGALSRTPLLSRSASPGSTRATTPRAQSPKLSAQSPKGSAAPHRKVTIQSPSMDQADKAIDDILKDDDDDVDDDNVGGDSFDLDRPLPARPPPKRNSAPARRPPPMHTGHAGSGPMKTIEQRQISTAPCVLMSMKPLEGREFYNPHPMLLYVCDRPLSPMLFQQYNVKRTISVRVYNLSLSKPTGVIKKGAH